MYLNLRVRSCYLMEKEHSLLSVQWMLLLGHRERGTLQIIAENDGILTADMLKLAAEKKLYREEYEYQNGLNKPHLLLQEKGLVRSSSKGGRAKYWHLTQLGQMIQAGTGCLAKTSANYNSLQSDMKENALPRGVDVRVAIIWLYDLICRKLSNGQREKVLQQLPETVRQMLLNRTEVIA